MLKIIAVTVQTAIPVDRSVDRKFKNKSRCRLTVDRPVDPKIQRANVLQSGMLRSTARSTVKRAHGYAHAARTSVDWDGRPT